MRIAIWQTGDALAALADAVPAAAHRGARVDHLPGGCALVKRNHNQSFGLSQLGRPAVNSDRNHRALVRDSVNRTKRRPINAANRETNLAGRPVRQTWPRLPCPTCPSGSTSRLIAPILNCFERQIDR
jgi:hypothetical protein